MPADSADILGKKGTSFSFTTTSGSLTNASAQGAFTGTVSVDASGNGSVSNMPAGDSTLLLTIILAPGESNPKLKVVTSNPPLIRVTSADIITDGSPTCVITLFGQ